VEKGRTGREEREKNGRMDEWMEKGDDDGEEEDPSPGACKFEVTHLGALHVNQGIFINVQVVMARSV